MYSSHDLKDLNFLHSSIEVMSSLKKNKQR